VSELSDLFDAADALAARGEQMALATIVATRGSTYRHAGARLLVPGQGDPVGNISGGCLEDDVARIGREVIDAGVPRLVEFDMTAEDDAVWGYGLGCNGAIELFVEPTVGALATVAALREAVGSCLVTTLTGPDAGTHRRETEGVAGDVLRLGRPRVEERSGHRILYEPILSPLRLVICGAGHDAVPLAREARELGWRVTVADVRRALLTAARFPGADFSDVDPGRAGTALALDERTAAVLMGHNYLRDAAYLGALLDAPLGYLGVLGPRGRTEQMLNELGRPEAIDRLHAPAGLDIGAEGPEEVARSVIAEILAVMRGRSGGSLRERTGPIHDAAG